MSDLETKPLTMNTWEAFVALCDRHSGGGFGGCYCTWFHREKDTKAKALAAQAGRGPEDTAEPPWTLEFKRCRVEAGTAHAALVFDGEAAVGWAQYGPPSELPSIFHRKEVELPGEPLPDWRITCVFVDRKYRRRGIALFAVHGALELIAEAGGGAVEAYPQDTTGGVKVSASFLYSATRSTFEQAGFAYDRHKGKNHCVMRRVVTSANR